VQASTVLRSRRFVIRFLHVVHHLHVHAVLRYPEHWFVGDDPFRRRRASFRLLRRRGSDALQCWRRGLDAALAV